MSLIPCGAWVNAETPQGSLRVLHTWGGGAHLSVFLSTLRPAGSLSPQDSRRTGLNIAPGWEHERLVSKRTFVRGPVRNVQEAARVYQ